MDIGRRHIVDDRMGDCQSFGSHYQSSQTRKISIGIMADSKFRAKSGPLKEKEVAGANTDKNIQSKENFLGDKRETKAVDSPIRNQAEPPEQDQSPWVSSRSKSPTLKTHVIPDKEDGNNLIREKNSTKFHSSQGTAKDSFNLQAGNNKLDNLHRVTYRRRQAVDGTTDKVESFSFGTAQEDCIQEKCAIEDTTTKPNAQSIDALRMKLNDILGTVSSPNKLFSNSQPRDLDSKFSKLDKVSDVNDDTTREQDNKMPKLDKVSYVKGDKVVKSRQNSDSIETDSENTDHTTKRPVTRSLTRKRAPIRVQQKKVEKGPSTMLKQSNQDKNIFSFQEGLAGGLSADNGGSLLKKKDEIRSSNTGPRKISFLKKYNTDKIPQVNPCKNISVPTEKSSSLGSKIGDYCALPPKAKREYVKPKNLFPEKDFHDSPVARNPVPVREHASPVSLLYADQPEDHGNPFLNNSVKQQDDLQSPALGGKSPSNRSSSSSPFNADQMNAGGNTPALAKKIFTGSSTIRSFKALQTLKPSSNKSKTQIDSSDDEEEPKDSPIEKSTPSVAEKDERLNDSPPHERNSTSSNDDSPIVGGYNGRSEDEALSPEKVTAKKPTSILHSAKRFQAHGGIMFTNVSPISPTTQGCTEDETFSPENFNAERPTSIFHSAKRHCSRGGIKFNEVSSISPITEGDRHYEPSEAGQDDGLYRAVTLFALALERLQNKVNSMTRQKSSEILMSTVDGINLQTQNVESQIQADIGKLTSLCKSKRKRLETRFQEQEEKLKTIYEKFKDDLNQNLQDCCNTLEGFEENKIEFKGTIEKQKASHKKLLVQVEEAIAFQLSDAERRITTVHKVANERMVELKKVIAECLMEGVLE